MPELNERPSYLLFFPIFLGGLQHDKVSGYAPVCYECKTTHGAHLLLIHLLIVHKKKDLLRNGFL